MLFMRQGAIMRRIASLVFIACLVLGSAPRDALPVQARVESARQGHAPLVFAPAGITVLPGPQAGGTLLGAVKFSSFGGRGSEDLFLGTLPGDTTPTKNRINFYTGVSVPATGVKYGNCKGNWDTSSSNFFDLRYQPAVSDQLTITIRNTNIISPLDCSLHFIDFTKQVSKAQGLAASEWIKLMNFVEVSVKRGSPNYTSTVSNLILNDSVALGSFSPTATGIVTNHVTGFHLGDGFKLSGAIDMTGTFGTCAIPCEIEIRFGAAPAQIVVQKQVNGIAPADDWQFSGPKGAWTLPALGGTTLITPLGSSTYVISETTKHGFSSSAACSNGATGGNSVSVTPNAGEIVTCTFTSSALPSDLSISKAVVSDSVQAGGTITYALVVSNAGAGPAYHAIITDRVPPSLTVIGAQSSVGLCSIAGNDITCDAGFINTQPLSAPVTVMVTATAPSDNSAIGLTITNTAGVTDALDATPANNTAERAITLRAIDAGQIVVRNIVSGLAPAGTFGYALLTPAGETPFTLNAGGNVTFTDMTPGPYSVSTTAAMGYATRVDCDGKPDGAFTLHAGATVTCTFAHAGTNTIAGALWHDRNENNAIDANEWRLPHVTVVLSGALAGGSLSALTQTSNAGAYAFAGLPDGAYGVTVLSDTLPAGVVTPTQDADGADTPHTAQTALCCNATTLLNFGYRGDGRIGGRVFFDTDNNGALSAGDLPLPGAVVQLTGELNNDDALDVLTATHSAGGYAFTSILSGVYTLTVDAALLPAGLLTSTPKSVVIALGDAPMLDVNFGFRGTGRISGIVWEDANGDGVADADEPRLDAALTLQGDLNSDGAADVLRAQAITGVYAFDHLVAGVYTITVDETTLPAGMLPLTQVWRVETLSQDEAKDNIDIPFVRLASMGGRVWLDANRNGATDAGERGIGGVTVALFEATSANDGIAMQAIAASPIATTTTDAQGVYGFAQLMPGRRYLLNFTLPAGHAWAIGDGSAIDGSGNSGVFTVTSGAQGALQMNAGATQPTRVILQKTTQQTMLGADGRITYTLVVRNAGETLAAQTLISDPLPSALSFVSAMPWPSVPPAEGAPLLWAIGDLPAGQAFTITLVTQLEPNAALAGSTVVNTAYVLGDFQTIARTNDLQSSATSVLQPSAITLASFSATMEGGGVRLAWRTAMEHNTFGFFVLRSATGHRADAARVHAEIIPAGNGNYALLDAVGALNSAYWLQEVELDGTMREEGPFRVTAAVIAAPAQAVAAQPVPLAQPAPAGVMTLDSQGSVEVNATLSALPPAQPGAATPQGIEPAATPTPQATPGQAPAREAPLTTPADASAATRNTPAQSPVLAAPSPVAPAATATPEAHFAMNATGLTQAVSVQRGIATPQATAMHGNAPRDADVPFPAILLLSAVGLSGVLLLAMGISDMRARRRDGRR
jgi:uncharacterized repeat protein (TIGR01451 family)